MVGDAPTGMDRPVHNSSDNHTDWVSNGYRESSGRSQMVNQSGESNGNSTLFMYMDPVEAAFATLIWIVILLTASIGNIMVIVAIFTHPALYIVQNFLLVSLAVADILVRIVWASNPSSGQRRKTVLYGGPFFYDFYSVSLYSYSVLNLFNSIPPHS